MSGQADEHERTMAFCEIALGQISHPPGSQIGGGKIAVQAVGRETGFGQ